MPLRKGQNMIGMWKFKVGIIVLLSIHCDFNKVDTCNDI